MYPNLSYFFNELFGTERDNWMSVFQTFGLLLASAFFVAAYFLYKELKRKEEEGLIHSITEKRVIGEGAKLSEVLMNGLFGLFFMLKFPAILMDFATFKQDAAGFIFSMKGNWPLGILGFVAFAGYNYWSDNKKKLATPQTVDVKVHPYQRVGDMTFIAAVFGILGARLFSILENLDSFWQDPIGQLFSGSGLTIHGGLILAFIANYIYVKSKQIKPIHVMDSIAPALMISYGVGRLGCQLSGDGDWGIVNDATKPSWFVFPDWAWAYNYPHNVIDNGSKIADCVGAHCMELVPSVFPTPLYETVLSFLIFGILWLLRKNLNWAGGVFFLYLVLMSIERYFIEFIRVNPRYGFLGLQLSQAQIISIGLFLIGLVGLFVSYKKSRSSSVK